MTTWIVKFFIPNKGFWFITLDNWEDLFFHITSCVSDYSEPQQGDKVGFEIWEWKKWAMAQNVSLLERQSIWLAA